ncbi:MAG: hypothetical protein JXA10_17175 [Anaerolineae bacterium]|nr:hypothetical protein [Anaerolineae bacterium]
MFNMENCDTHSAADFGRYLFSAYSAGLRSFENAAQLITDAVYDEFRNGDGSRVFSLVRVFRLAHVTELASDLVDLAADEAEYVLVLAGSRGDEPAWNGRHASRNHRVVSPTHASPMFRAALEQLGLNWGRVSDQRALKTSEQAWSTRSFFVADVQGCSLIPDQATFVERYGIYSLIGLGGAFIDGNGALLFAFSNVPVDATCERNFAQLSPFLLTVLATYNERGVIWCTD